MPLIWPILTPADLAAAEQPTISAPAEQASNQTPEPSAAAWRPHESVVWSDDMPAITAGVLLLVTIIFGTIYKLFAARERQRHRPTHRDRQPPAASVARPRKLASLALAGHQGDFVREPVATSRRLGVARKPRDSGDVSRDIDDDFLERLKWLRRAA